jgi:hypothetical protein
VREAARVGAGGGEPGDLGTADRGVHGLGEVAGPYLAGQLGAG